MNVHVRMRRFRHVILTLGAIGVVVCIINTFSEYQAYWKNLPERQRQRLSFMRGQCKRHNLGRMDDSFNLTLLNRKVKLLYSDRYKFILCEIPKCASSSMKKLLLTTEKLVDISDATKVKSEMAHIMADSMLDLRHLSDTAGISKRIRTYKKLLIVRDPMYRLLSAYRNKLEKEYPWSKPFADISKHIHSQFAPNDKSESLATFSEFLRFAAVDSDRERHWELYNNLCLPCTIRFDFIAHVETIQDDMDAFMKLVKMDNLTFPSNYDATQQTNNAKIMRYMEKVPQNVVEEVFDNYKLDFELFGFAKPVLANHSHSVK